MKIVINYDISHNLITSDFLFLLKFITLNYETFTKHDYIFLREPW